MAAASGSSSASHALHGSYSIAPAKSSASIPKAIHVRLTEETLAQLLGASRDIKGKGKSIEQHPKISLDLQNASNPTLKIGNSVHQISQSVEKDPHEIYMRPAGQANLELVAKLGHKFIVQHELGESMKGRVRERAEAAAHERDDRRIIALDYDPKVAKNGTRSPALQKIQSPSASRAGSPILGRSGSPARNESPVRKSNLLVANDSAHKRARSPGRAPPHSPSHLNRSFTVEVEEITFGSEVGEQETEDKNKPAANSMHESSSSSGGEATSFSFSSGSSTSGTSITSGDSPPSKEEFAAVVTSTHLSASAAAPDLSAFGISRQDKPQPDRAMQSKPVPSELKTKVVTITRAPSKAPQPLAGPSTNASSSANLKRKRNSLTADQSTSDDSAPPVPRKVGGPKANARTAGGARVSRPATKTKAGSADRKSDTSSQRASPLPSVASAEAAASESSSSQGKKRKSDVAGNKDEKKAKRSKDEQRAKNWYTSDEDEGMSEDADADGEPDDSLATSARGRPAAAKPLNTVMAAMAADPLAPQRQLFAELKEKYQVMHKDTLQMRQLIQAIVDGQFVPDSQRRTVWSKKEITDKLDALQTARKELLGLRDYILNAQQ